MQENTPPPSGESPDILLSWNAQTHPDHKRSDRWYLIGGILVLLGAAYGILTHSWSLSIVILLCGAIYYLLKGHTPEAKTITLTRQGVLFEGAFTRWEDLKSFWLIATPHYTELHMTPRSRTQRMIRIQTGDIPTPDIRLVLSHFLQEESDKQENFIDTFIRICKL